MKKKILQLAFSPVDANLDLAIQLCISQKWWRGIEIISEVHRYTHVEFVGIYKAFVNDKSYDELEYIYNKKQNPPAHYMIHALFDEQLEFAITLDEFEQLGLETLDVSVTRRMPLIVTNTYSDYKRFKPHFRFQLKKCEDLSKFVKEIADDKDWEFIYNLGAIRDLCKEKGYHEYLRDLFLNSRDRPRDFDKFVQKINMSLEGMKNFFVVEHSLVGVRLFGDGEQVQYINVSNKTIIEWRKRAKTIGYDKLMEELGFTINGDKEMLYNYIQNFKK